VEFRGWNVVIIILMLINENYIKFDMQK
jgi:hypothetical protein